MGQPSLPLGWTTARALGPQKTHQAWGLNPALINRLAGGDYVSLRNLGEGQAMQMLFDGFGSIAGLVMPCDLSGTKASEELIQQIMEVSND